MIVQPAPGSRPQFSGHETFPLRQLWLRKAWQAVDAGAAASPFGTDDAIIDFGVGKNMVSSIRFWATACRVIREEGDAYVTTPLGDTLFSNNGLDPYCEHPATAWLIHWLLANSCDKTATWYFLFNHVTQGVFDRDAVVAAVMEGLEEFSRTTPNARKVSLATLKRDVDCCIRSYVPRAAGESPEEMSEPLLGELGLIQQNARSNFEFRRGAKKSLPDGIFAYALLDYWQRQATGSVLAFERVAHDFGSPGRVFKLHDDAIADRLMALSDLTGGELQWTEQSGIRQVTRRGGVLADIEQAKNKILRTAYGQE